MDGRLQLLAARCRANEAQFQRSSQPLVPGRLVADSEERSVAIRRIRPVAEPDEWVLNSQRRETVVAQPQAVVLCAAARAAEQQVAYRQAGQGGVHQREGHSLREVVVGAEEQVVGVGIAQQPVGSDGVQRIGWHRGRPAAEV